MAQTYTTYTVSSSSVLDYSFDFDVIDDSFVEVTKNGEELVNPTDFSVNATTKVVTLTTPPEVGDVLYIRRTTPRTEPVVEFVDAAREMAANLNKALLQPLHVIEEIGEAGGGALSLNEDGHYDAGGKRIVNLGEPVDDSDAATKVYTDDLVTAALTFGPEFPRISSYTGTSDGLSNTTQMSLDAGSSSGYPFTTDANHWEVVIGSSNEVGAFVVVPPSLFSISTGSGGTVLFVTIDPSFSLPADWTVKARLLGNRRDYVGAATSAGAWTTARTLTLGNDLSGNVSIDGSSNVTLNATLATVGTVTPNTLYTNANIKVDAKGRVIELANGSGAVDMDGADGTNPGVSGLAPAPAATDNYKFLRGDAQWAYAPGVNGQQVFTSNGTFNVPAGVSKLKVTVVGGGGSGYTDTYNGARAQAVFSVTPGAAISVSVGSAGNTSSFGAYLVCPTGGASAPVVSGTESASATSYCVVPRYKTLAIPASQVASLTSAGTMTVSQEFGDHEQARTWSATTGVPTSSHAAAPGIVIVEW